MKFISCFLCKRSEGAHFSSISMTMVSKDTDYLFCIFADSLGVQGRKVQASSVDGCRQVIYFELFLLLNLVYFLNGNQHHSRAKSRILCQQMFLFRSSCDKVCH